MNHCIDCTRWNPKETSEGLLKVGMAWCMDKHPLHTVRAFAIACPKFEARDDGREQDRREWLKKKMKG